MGDANIMVSTSLVVILMTACLAHGLPTANDIVPEYEPSPLAQFDEALRKDERAHMSKSDLAMEEIEDATNNDDVLLETEPKLAGESAKVHSSIVALKAYAVDVHLKASEAEDQVGDKGSSLVPFLKAFGKDPEVGDKKKKGGIISEYAELYAKSLEENETGLGKYQLEHMNAAILEGREILTFHKDEDAKTHYWILNTDELGLQSPPEYLVDMGDSMAKWSASKIKIEEANTKADTEAALDFVTKEHNKAFAAYFKAEADKADAAKAADQAAIKEEALRAEKQAFDTAYSADSSTKLLHVAVQSDAAMQAQRPAAAGPSYEDMKTVADEAASKVDTAAQESVDTTTKLVKVLEEQAEADDAADKEKEAAAEEKAAFEKEEAAKALEEKTAAVEKESAAVEKEATEKEETATEEEKSDSQELFA